MLATEAIKIRPEKSMILSTFVAAEMIKTSCVTILTRVAPSIDKTPVEKINILTTSPAETLVGAPLSKMIILVAVVSVAWALSASNPRTEITIIILVAAVSMTWTLSANNPRTEITIVAMT